MTGDRCRGWTEGVSSPERGCWGHDGVSSSHAAPIFADVEHNLGGEEFNHHISAADGVHAVVSKSYDGATSDDPTNSLSSASVRVIDTFDKHNILCFYSCVYIVLCMTLYDICHEFFLEIYEQVILHLSEERLKHRSDFQKTMPATDRNKSTSSKTWIVRPPFGLKKNVLYTQVVSLLGWDTEATLENWFLNMCS